MLHFWKNSGVTRRVVASSATALAPFSQNSIEMAIAIWVSPRATHTIEATLLIDLQ